MFFVELTSSEVQNIDPSKVSFSLDDSYKDDAASDENIVSTPEEGDATPEIKLDGISADELAK